MNWFFIKRKANLSKEPRTRNSSHLIHTNPYIKTYAKINHSKLKMEDSHSIKARKEVCQTNLREKKSV